METDKDKQQLAFQFLQQRIQAGREVPHQARAQEIEQEKPAETDRRRLAQ